MGILSGESISLQQIKIIFNSPSTTSSTISSRCQEFSAKSLIRFLDRSSLQDRSNLHLGSYTRLPTLRPDRSILKMTRTDRNTMKAYMLGIKEDMAGTKADTVRTEVIVEGTKEDTAGIEVATAGIEAGMVGIVVAMEATKEDTAGIEVATAVTKADMVRTEVVVEGTKEDTAGIEVATAV